MRIDYGGLLSLDDIESIAHRLNEYGSDQAAAGAVAQKSLRAFISEIDSTLSEISSLEELDVLGLIPLALIGGLSPSECCGPNRMIPERDRFRIDQADADRAPRHVERSHEAADKRARDPQSALLH